MEACSFDRCKDFWLGIDFDEGGLLDVTKVIYNCIFIKVTKVIYNHRPMIAMHCNYDDYNHAGDFWFGIDFYKSNGSFGNDANMPIC